MSMKLTALLSISPIKIAALFKLASLLLTSLPKNELYFC